MALDVWPDHDERKNAGTFSMRHDVDPENVLSLSARFRSRFFRRFILDGTFSSSSIFEYLIFKMSAFFTLYTLIYIESYFSFFVAPFKVCSHSLKSIL